MDWLLAHQGGWDEVLMFGIPVIIAIGAVKWAERRGARKREELEDTMSDRHAEDGGS